MQSSQAPLLLAALCTGKPPPSLGELIPKLLQSPTLRYSEPNNHADLDRELNAAKAGVVILVINDKEEFRLALEFLARHAALIQQGLLRPLAFSFIRHPKIPTLLRAKGVVIVFDDTATPRSLALRIQQNIQAITDRQRKDEAKRDNLGKRELGTTAGALGSAPASAQREIVWLPALTDEADYWLIDKKTDVRNVMGRWFVDLVGPSTNIGNWEPIQHGTLGKGLVWRTRASADSLFELSGGEWIFLGQAAEPNWTTQRWKLMGREPKLCFVKTDGTIVTRVNFEPPARIILTENSPQAATLLSSIQATWAMEVKTVKGAAPVASTEWNDDNSSRAPGQEEVDNAFEREMILATNRGLGQGQGGPQTARTEDAFGGRFGIDDVGGALNLGSGLSDLKLGAEAFESFDLVVTILEVRADQPINPLPVILVENSATELCLEVPAGLLQPQLRPVLKFSSATKDPRLNFSISATVQAVEELGDGIALATLGVQGRHLDGLESLAQAYAQRQREAEEFLKVAKGF